MLILYKKKHTWWSPTPPPLAYPLYAFINVDNFERPLTCLGHSRFHNIVHTHLHPPTKHDGRWRIVDHQTVTSDRPSHRPLAMLRWSHAQMVTCSVRPGWPEFRGQQIRMLRGAFYRHLGLSRFTMSEQFSCHYFFPLAHSCRHHIWLKIALVYCCRCRHPCNHQSSYSTIHSHLWKQSFT